MAKRSKRILRVTGMKPITNIKLANGGTTTLYEVFATTEDGGYVEEALRAFTELDVGQLLEYEIEPYNHKRWGMSYTLYPPKKETARRLRELEEKMKALIGWAENQGLNFQRALKPESPSPSAAAGAEAEGRKKEAEEKADEKYGTEAPWTDDYWQDPERPPDTDPPPEDPPPAEPVEL